MKIRLFAVCFALLACTVAGGAVVLEDLSPEAQALLPKKLLKQILLTSGKHYEGEVLKESETTMTVRLYRGEQVAIRTLLKSQVKSVEDTDLGGLLASGLLARYRLGESSLPDADYEQALTRLAEFFALWPDHDRSGVVRARHAEIAEEYERHKEGLRKVRQMWVNPVEATVWKFLYYGGLAKALQDEHHGIERDAFAGDKKLKTQYDDFRDKRRAATRELPSMMRERQPLLLRGQKFDSAAAELTSFMHFILRMVLPTTSGEQEFRRYFGGDIWDQIDYKVVTGMQRTFHQAYAQAAAAEPEAGVRERADMVYVPGGYFLMGDESAKPGTDTFPMHIVFVSPFLMDKHEVSNADYRKFIEQIKTQGDDRYAHENAPMMKDYSPEGWKHNHLNGDLQPVVGVDWFDAYAYGRFVGKRLPTEAEWERAARGDQYAMYPWGKDDPGGRGVNCPDGRAVLAADMDRQDPPEAPESGWFSCKKEEPTPTRLAGATWEVNAHLPARARKNENFIWEAKENSPYGTMHLVGNAAEWVADWYSKDYYSRSPIWNPKGPSEDDGTTVHVYRGGDYMSPKGELTCHWRGVARTPALKNGGRSANQPTIGFRCVKSLEVVKSPILESAIDKILAEAVR